MTRYITGILFIASLFIFSCSDSDGPEIQENEPFDRSQMLSSWADHFIIPGFESYAGELDELVSAKDAFIANPDVVSLNSLKSAWLDAYKSWQKVSMFDIGKAEEIGLRNFTNIYPADTDLINENITSGNFNLALPSNFDAQGFPALDYLLYGLSPDDSEIVTMLSQTNHAQYLDALIERLRTLGNEILNDWKGNYRDQFIQNDGSSATASVDKLVNDFLFYYEKYLRAGKIGIPAGVFSGGPISNSVEAPYSGIFSKDLFNIAFQSVQDFFNGRGYNGISGNSLDDYLKFTSNVNGTRDIASEIQSQWKSAEAKIEVLLPNFRDQVEQDNIKMLEAYDELQKAVVLLKVEMMQALNIRVDFVDADGD